LIQFFEGIARLAAALIVGSDERLKAFVLGLRVIVFGLPDFFSHCQSSPCLTLTRWGQIAIGIRASFREPVIDQKNLAAMGNKGVPVTARDGSQNLLFAEIFDFLRREGSRPHVWRFQDFLP
jgi:hypothetical protein